jgi:hypothetical protein
VTITVATKVSIRPKRSTARAHRLSASAPLVASAGAARASPPNASISATAFASACSFRAETTTFAPRAPAALATARPIPLDAPATTITCSASGLFTGPASPGKGLDKRW